MAELLTNNAIRDELSNLPGWTLGAGFLEKDFLLKNFKEAIAVMVRIGFEAENMNHHPDWTNVYNRLKIRLTSHDSGGVTTKDLQLARRIEEVMGTWHPT